MGNIFKRKSRLGTGTEKKFVKKLSIYILALYGRIYKSCKRIPAKNEKRPNFSCQNYFVSGIIKEVQLTAGKFTNTEEIEEQTCSLNYSSLQMSYRTTRCR